jgi:hypothetical protein
MTRFVRKTLIAAALTTAFVAGNAMAIDASLKTEKDKISYMVGADVGRGLSQIKDELDLKLVLQALQDEFNGGKTLMTQEEGQTVRQEFMQKLQAKRVADEKVAADKNKAEGTAYLAKNKAKAGVKTTTSGLQYEVIKQGTGPMPKATDTVKVDYTGTKVDGFSAPATSVWFKAPCWPMWGTTWCASTSTPPRSPRCRPARFRSTSPAWRRSCRATRPPAACASPPTRPRAWHTAT